MASVIAISKNLTGTLADIYTVPSGKIALIENIMVNSVTAGNITIKIYRAADTSAYNYWPEIPISSNGIEQDFQLRLLTGDKIQASAATTTDAVITLSGIQDNA